MKREDNKIVTVNTDIHLMCFVSVPGAKRQDGLKWCMLVCLHQSASNFIS